jgi:hypothetical protein
MTVKRKSKEEKESCRMITPEFRVSYPHLFTPQSPDPKSKKKFSVTMLFPKDPNGKSPMGLSPDGKPRSISEVIRAAKISEFGPDKKDWPGGLRSPVLDGDDPDFEGKAEYKGHWVIKASTGEEQRPSVVGRDMTPITEANEVYPGCYARAYVYAYVYTFMGRQGVTFILDHVQKLRDGKALGGGKKPVEQVFTPLEDPTGPDEDEEEDFR